MTYLQPLRASRQVVEETPSNVWFCRRCGLKHTSGKPHASGECESCRDAENVPEPKKNRRYKAVASRVPGLKSKCNVWLGDYDDDENPITPEGDLVMPGGRVCGHRDCIAPSHLIREVALVA